MRTVYFVLVLLVLAIAVVGWNKFGGDDPPATMVDAPPAMELHPLGKQIADFTLDDYLGATYSLAKMGEHPATVVVFLGVECPLAKLYSQRLAELAAEYEPRGVQFIAINSNQQDTLTELTHFARKHGIEFPLLKDPGGKVADDFGATRTPEAYLLDGERTIRYFGRIDDQYGVGYSRGEPTERFLVAALEDLLAGEPIAKPETSAVGCLISRPKHVAPHGEVTYSNQVARIIQRRCIECHREGQIAPFALESYADAAAWSDMLLEVIDQGRMPPWHANPEHGEFMNDSRMSDEEKQLLAKWVANGMPEGDRAELPPPRAFAEGWRISEPDVVYRMPFEYQVPAKGVVEYKYFVIDPGFTEDVWVKASEARPGNRSVVHHLILFYQPPGQDRWQPQDALFNMIAAFAPGLPAFEDSGDVAMRIPAGSKLVFQLHYTPNGSEQIDQSEVGLVFAQPGEVVKELKTDAALNYKFLIPAGADNYGVKAEYTVGEDSLLYSLAPHMHYRGKSFLITAHYPDTGEEILLDVPRYDFNWQNVYMLAEPKLMPANTRIVMEARYDNSAANLLNPDPTQTVHWGDQTWEEMMVGSVTLAAADQDLRPGPPRVEPLGDGLYDVTFRYKPKEDEQIEIVYLAGFFNDWQQKALALDGPDAEGWYSTQMQLPEGDHEYKFVVDGETWKADPANPDQTGFYGNSVVKVH